MKLKPWHTWVIASFCYFSRLTSNVSIELWERTPKSNHGSCIALVSRLARCIISSLPSSPFQPLHFSFLQCLFSTPLLPFQKREQSLLYFFTYSPTFSIHFPLCFQHLMSFFPLDSSLHSIPLSSIQYTFIFHTVWVQKHCQSKSMTPYDLSMTFHDQTR